MLRIKTDRPAAEVARRYKQLLTVKQLFRAAKDLLETRQVFHKYEATTTGHIFVSFLALVLRHELRQRLTRRVLTVKRSDVMCDLALIREVEVLHRDEHYLLRPSHKGVAGKAFQAVGAASHPHQGRHRVVPRRMSRRRSALPDDIPKTTL
jgi:hypothetical protein